MSIDYLTRVIGHRGFSDGQLHTGFLAEHAHDLLAAPDATANARAMAVAALGCRDIRIMLDETPPIHARVGHWRN